MSNPETVESFLRRSGVPHDSIDDTTWVIQLDNQRHSRIALRVQEPIILFTTNLMDLTEETPQREKLLRRLLELNTELLYCSYAIQEQRIILSGAHPLESLDPNEFQAILDDMTMALDRHLDLLSEWQNELQTHQPSES